MRKSLAAGCLFALIICGCTSREKMDGNVYKLVADEKSGMPEQGNIRGLRIDVNGGDTLLVKYAIGSGAFLDADFIYISKPGCYKSTTPLVFGQEGERSSVVRLSVTGSGEIVLQFVDMGGTEERRYRKIYRMKVDLKTHRDPYYAEDGFKL
ncbi:MAG: hypothetical protein EOP49_15865 [Sphingobacteriales bacterium]|nr:MAG: hypothetical protein EOP49_15865 [Sphingobacteriales bacterium]